MQRRVLVTRPQPGGSATARALIAAGFEPIILPLTEIRPLAPAVVASGDFAALAVTSANAIRHAPDWLIARHAALPVFAVGDSTGAAAIQSGFAQVNAGPGDAEGLARLASVRLAAGARILYLCGHVRRPELERWLGRSGFDVVPVETYDTVPAVILPEQLTLLAPPAPPPFVVMVHSAEAARALMALEARPELGSALREAVHLCISERAAAPLREKAVARIVIAAAPTDTAMIAGLRALP